MVQQTERTPTRIEMHRLILITLILLAPLFAPTAQAAGIDPADLVRPEIAFQVEVSASADAAGDRLELHWEVADGYYLYRSRLSFTSMNDAVVLGEPEFPTGLMHSDEYFGEQEIYRGQVTIVIPLTLRSSATEPAPTFFDLEINSQGCADLGLCYPPQRWTRTVNLAPQSSLAPAGIIGQLAALGGAISGGDFLPVEQAFVPSLTARDAGTFVVRWEIADDYYLYRDQFSVTTTSEQVQLGLPRFPAGEEKTDEYFGTSIVYYHSVEIPVTVARPPGSEIEIPLQLGYQGCADAGLCYPPSIVDAVLLLPATGSAIAASGADSVGLGRQSEQDRLADTILTGALGTVLLLFFGFGLLLAFTPCILPMIPILSGIIVGQGESLGTGRALLLSSVYVLAMALTYTAAGVAAALLGQNLQAAFQDPWVLSGFSLVFVALALAMFGVYQFQLPAGLQTRLNALMARQQGGDLLGVATMGVLSALIVGPCVAAPLTAALVVIGQTGDPVRGGLALFSLSLGLGAPLIVVGASAGRLLPRAGPWMDRVKVLFGVLMLGVAIWLMARIVPGVVALFAWGTLALGAGVYTLQASRGSSSAGTLGHILGRRSLQLLGLILTIYGAVAIADAFAGGSDPLRPTAALMGEERHGLEYKRVKSLADLEAAVATATATGQPVMFDFYADWCVSCLEMERFTLADPAVIAALGDTVLLQADVTANDAVDQELLRHFGIYGPPTIVFWDRRGRQLDHLSVVGYLPADEFLVVVEEATR
jgi:thioredoxin:protein disulfide reductase